MREPVVKEHRFRETVVEALTTAQRLGENGPQAINRAARAIVAVQPGMMFDDAFQIVWNIWEA